MQDGLIAYLFYASPFKDIRYDNPISLDTIVNSICMWITQLLADLLGFFQKVLEYAWDFLQFGNFDTNKNGQATLISDGGKAVAGFYNLFLKWAFIPIGVCVLILIIRLFITTRARDDLKRFSYNLLILFAVVAILPSVIFNFNTKVLNNNKNNILSIDSQSIAAKIFWDNTTDYDYLYAKYVNKLNEKAEKDDSKDFIAFYKNNKSAFDRLTKRDADGNFEILKNQKNQFNHKEYSDDYFKINDLKSVDINESVFDPDWDEAFEWLDNVPIIGNLLKSKAVNDAKSLDASFNITQKPVMFTKKLNVFTRPIITSTLEQYKNAVVKSNAYKKSKSKNLSEIENAYYRGAIQGYYQDNKKSNLLSSKDTGEGILGAKLYYRYKTDFFVVWIELCANILLFFSAAYAILKIAWELIYHRIFLTWFAAMDLTGGDRVKRAVTSILGLYISIMFIAFTLVLYNNALSFINGRMSGLPKAIIVLMLASVALDGPNVIAKYFGVETGMRGGADMLKRGLGHGVNAARTAYMFKRMHDMKKGFRGRGYGAGSAAAEKFSKSTPSQKASQWARHPISTGKMVAGSKLGSKFDDVIDNFKNKRYANKSNEKFNEKRAEAGLPKKPSKNINDYIGTASHLEGDKKNDMMNYEMARDNIDDIAKSATLSKIANPEKLDSDAYADVLKNDGGFAESKDNYQNVANRLANDLSLNDCEQAMVYDTSAKSQELIKQKAYKHKEYEAHLSAARDTIGDGKGLSFKERQIAEKNLAGKSFAETHKESIRKQALEYMNNEECHPKEAIKHVIIENQNGCAGDFKYNQFVNKDFVDIAVNEIYNSGPLDGYNKSGRFS